MSAFWNYRVVECPGEDDVLYQVHAVEYNENGKPVNWSETGEAAFGSNLDGLADDLKRQQEALEKPVVTVKRMARGYELVEVESGEIAYSPVPESIAKP